MRETLQANQSREGTVYEKRLACTMPLKQQTLEVITEVFPLLGPLEKTMSALSDSQVPKVCHAKIKVDSFIILCLEWATYMTGFLFCHAGVAFYFSPLVGYFCQRLLNFSVFCVYAACVTRGNQLVFKLGCKPFSIITSIF